MDFLEYFMDYYQVIMPLIMTGCLIYASWQYSVQIRNDSKTIHDILIRKVKLTPASFRICARFFLENPGFLSIPRYAHDDDYYTPFHKACYILSAPLISLMIHHGAMVNECTMSKVSPFLICVSAIVMREETNFSSLTALLKGRCDINATYPRSKMTALHVAVLYRRLDLYCYLIANGIDRNMKDFDGLIATQYMKLIRVSPDSSDNQDSVNSSRSSSFLN